jgi:hypothetical protein
MDNEKVTKEWKSFTEEERRLLSLYMHVPMAECPAEAQDLKRAYWKMMKAKSRLSSKGPGETAHRNKAYVKWLVLNGYSTKVFCPKLYKRFQREGDLQ